MSCSKEEVLPPDNLIGEWNVYSISNNTDPAIIWEELKASAVALIPAYSCMEFTTVATEQIVTTRYVFIDENSAGCRNPVISAYTWNIDPDTGFYNFIQGNNIVEYAITFTNNDNRMTWIDQTSGDVTIWDRQVAAVTVTE
ncbi:MAG: lipocalin family protein [Flavobacteriaceae bacterium]